jgi:hypothetical protein
VGRDNSGAKLKEAQTKGQAACHLYGRRPDSVSISSFATLDTFRLGEVTMNAIKIYQESVGNGQRCVDKEFQLKSKDKNQKLSLKLRFVAI